MTMTTTTMISFDIPFEFVREVAGTGSVAETSHVERSATARRHGCFGAQERVLTVQMK